MGRRSAPLLSRGSKVPYVPFGLKDCRRVARRNPIHFSPDQIIRLRELAGYLGLTSPEFGVHRILKGGMGECIRIVQGENAFALKVIQHDIVEDPDAWNRYLQRPEERLSTGLIYGTLHRQTGGWAVYAQKMIYKEMFFRSHGKIPNWGLPLAKWSAETLMI